MSSPESLSRICRREQHGNFTYVIFGGEEEDEKARSRLRPCSVDGCTALCLFANAQEVPPTVLCEKHKK
jgi:hypothetical protein